LPSFETRADKSPNEVERLATQASRDELILRVAGLVCESGETVS
jgi:hypothetical protein